MTIFAGGGLTAAQVTVQVQTALANHRAALEALQDLYRWSSGVAQSDLQAIGFSAADALTLLAAIADGNAEAELHFTGQPPSTYPQAASTYVYASSQAQVLTVVPS